MEMQKLFLANAEHIFRRGLELDPKTYLKIIMAELKTYQKPITNGQKSPLKENMNGAPLTNKNYILKVVSDFIYFNDAFDYKPHTNRPLVNFILQKKIEGITIVDYVNHELLDCLLIAAKHLKPGKILYKFEWPIPLKYLGLIKIQQIPDSELTHCLLHITADIAKTYENFKSQPNKYINLDNGSTYTFTGELDLNTKIYNDGTGKKNISFNFGFV